jgi:hypothetical protein
LLYTELHSTYSAKHNNLEKIIIIIIIIITFVAAIARRRKREITKYKLMFQD